MMNIPPVTKILINKVVLLILLLFCANSLSAQSVWVDGVQYAVNKKFNHAYIAGIDGARKNIEIKEAVEIKGIYYKVKFLGKVLNYADELNWEVQFKTNIVKNCTLLESIKFPSSIDLLGSSFGKCKNLKTVFIFNPQILISSSMFDGCDKLENLYLPDTVSSVFVYNEYKDKLNRPSFGGCMALKNVKCHNGKIPAYIIPYLPNECPFVMAYNRGQYSNDNLVHLPNTESPKNSPKHNGEVSKVVSPNEEQSVIKINASDVDIDIPETKSKNENTFAIIFANESYQEEAKVDYALNDGEMFKVYCSKVLGLPESNIHLRKNATKNNMIAEISWMKKVADAYSEQARLIVFYAGHGIPDEKTGSAYLLPIDGIGTEPETAYSLAQFYKTLGSLPVANVTVFMDACFSGSKRGEGMLASARGVAIKAKAQAPQGKMVVFSAAQGDETAYPFKEKEHGLFTYYLLKKLKETKGNVTYGELGTYLQTEVKRKSIVANSKSQTPTVSSSQSVANSWKSMKLK